MTADDAPIALWDYSVALYGRPGVAAACLELQDRLGLDVNLLLFCVWSAACGPGRLRRADLEACVELTAPWRGRVVEPLRDIRRAGLAGQALPGDLHEQFRDRVLALELEAERIEQRLLADWARSRERALPADPAAIAAGNLVVYLAVAGAATRDAADAMRAILAAAFEPQPGDPAR